MSRWHYPCALAAVAAVGLVLRLSGLTERGLWLDEMVSLQVAARPWAEIARGAVFDNHTPPLYYLLLHLWLGAVPESLAALRLPSVLADVGCLVLLAATAGRLFGRSFGLVVGAAYAVAPFAVRLAQEGRMYTLLMLLVVATFALSLEVGDERRWPAVAAAATATAALYTHYYAVLFLAVLHAATAWRLRAAPVPRRRWWLAMGAAGLAFLPWLPVMARLLSGGGQGFRRFTASVIPYAALRFAVGFSVLPTTVDGKQHLTATLLHHLPLLAAVGAVTAAVGLLGVRRALRACPAVPGRGPCADPRLASHATPAWVGATLAGLVAVPAVLALAVTVVVPSLDERYLAICFPFFLLLAVLGVVEAGTLRGGRWLKAAALALFVTAAACQTVDPAAGTTPWRRGAAELRRLAPPPAHVLVAPAYYAPLVARYVQEPARVGRLREVRAAAAKDDAPIWLLEVAFLSDRGEELRRTGWQVEERLLLRAGNGLRLSRLERPPPDDR